MDRADTWQQHAADTLQEIHRLADPRIVRIVPERAARGIEYLEHYGMPVRERSRRPDSPRFFGAHT